MKKLTFMYLALIVCISAQSIQNHDFNQVVNVTDYGVVAGSGDDYAAIQAIFNEIADRITNGQPVNNVYFPDGVYHISNTLKIPPTITVYGTNSTYNHDGLWNGELDATLGVRVIIKLMNNSNCDMIQPYNLSGYNYFEGVTISNLTLDGNKANNTSNPLSKGIYLPASSSMVNNNFSIKSVLVAKVNGTGIWIDGNYSGVEIKETYCAMNVKDGFHFYNNESISIWKCWSAGNYDEGFYFRDCSNSDTLDRCDSWGNANNGFYFENCENLNVENIQADINYGNGVAIVRSSNITFAVGTICKNSRWCNTFDTTRDDTIVKPDRCSEVILIGYADNSGCENITFKTINFGNMFENSHQLKYAINNFSFSPTINLIEGCSFVEKNYLNGTVSDNVFKYYKFIGCNGGSNGTVGLTNPFAIIETNESPFHIYPNLLKLTVDTQTGWKQIKLPDMDLVDLNKEFLIYKKYVDNNYVLITPMDYSTLDGNQSTPTQTVTYYSKDISTNLHLAIEKQSNSNWSLLDQSNTGYIGYVNGAPALNKSDNTVLENDNPNSFELFQNYPNPFNPVTQIKYSLPMASVVKIKVFNILGKEVATLVNELQSAGIHQISFDASKLSSGTYFYVIQSKGKTISKKMNLIK